MPMKSVLVALAAILLGLPAAAQDCTLKQVASLDLVDSTDGYILAPLTISGTTRYFYLNLASPLSYVESRFADEMKLTRKGLGKVAQAVNADAIVFLPSLQFGAATGTNVPVLVRTNASPYGDSRAVGVLALDLLSSFDIELDLARSKLNLFSQEHCPGKVVYWANEFTTVPLSYRRNQDLHLEMSLDGQSVDVLLNPSTPRSQISMAIAYYRLGLGPESPGMELVSDSNSKVPLYKYPFKTLSAGGVTIRNPSIYVFGNQHDVICDRKSFPIQCFGQGLMLTKSELKQLHLYLALTEGVAYVTSASTHK